MSESEPPPPRLRVVDDEVTPTADDAPSASTLMRALSDSELVTTWQLFRRVLGRVDSRLSMPMPGVGHHSAQTTEAMARLAAAPDRMLPMSELATSIGLSSGGLTKLVDRLVQAGLVERHHSRTDRRVVYAALTDSGAAVEQETTPEYAGRLRRDLAGVGYGGLYALHTICEQLDRDLATAETDGNRGIHPVTKDFHG